MIRALIAATLLLTACGRSTGGPMEPVEAPGIQMSEDHDGVRAATVHEGSVSARVVARWSDTGGQSAKIVYANQGRTAVRIDLGTLSMTGPAGEAVVMSAADVTNTNLLDKRSDNDDARVLLERDNNGVAKGKLDLPAGAERRVDAQLSPFSNTVAAEAGERVIVHVPMPGASLNVASVTRNPSLSPFR
jgi:hypothetical protein